MVEWNGGMEWWNGTVEWWNIQITGAHEGELSFLAGSSTSSSSATFLLNGG